MDHAIRFWTASNPDDGRRLRTLTRSR